MKDKEREEMESWLGYSDEIPEEAREAVATWIMQGRDEEHIYAVINFFTGAGQDLIAQERRKARLDTFKEVLSACNDSDQADRKWSRGDFIKYMKYELGWNDRSGKPINDPFPDELKEDKEA